MGRAMTVQVRAKLMTRTGMSTRVSVLGTKALFQVLGILVLRIVIALSDERRHKHNLTNSV